MSSNAKLSAVAERTVKVLQEVYGFSRERSVEAVNAITNKGDVQMACNWLFDHGEEDRGGAVDFVVCDHLTTPLEKKLILESSLKYGESCVECANKGENWVCLFCGETRCSRYAKGHAISHHQQTKSEEEGHTHVSAVMSGATLPLGHFLAISLMDLSVWCYECQAYVTAPSLEVLTKQMSSLKFGEPAKKKKKVKEEDKVQRSIGVGLPMEARDWTVMHGFLGDSAWEPPITVSDCDEEARPGYKSMKASEYFDTPSVLDAKVKLLALMITNSSNFVAYTGAGISTSSGIPDYASKSSSVMSQDLNKNSPLSAPPTLSHIVLTNLHFAGRLKHWVQQNHDGLPQKAGFPQKHLNEIHGAWFDPSNPVVPMSGTLREDELKQLLEWEAKADLCLSLGTTMCGMNSDRVFHTCAKAAFRASQSGKKDPADVLGGVIINLQQTQYDSLSSLRIFAKLDDVMSRLADLLQISKEPITLPRPESKVENVFENLPYSKQGKRDPSASLTLDLRPGALVRLVRQPQWDLERKGNVATVLGQTPEGHYVVDLDGKVKRNLGVWWITDAQRGDAEWLPIVNA